MIRRRRTLFIVDGGLAVLLGAGLLLAPVQLLLAFGVTIGPAPSVVTRLLGAAILSHGAVLILTRDHVDGAVGTALIRGHLVFDVLGLAISVATFASAGGFWPSASICSDFGISGGCRASCAAFCASA